MNTPVVKRSVLVVDDSGVFGFTLSLEFRKRGWDVYCCGNAEEALKTMQERDFHLVLSDILMPGMPGDELARRIVENRPGVKVILMSSMPREQVPPLPRGVAFVPKPVNVEKIVSAYDMATRPTGALPPPPPHA
jgi:CheY-like chemotaxis protein